MLSVQEESILIIINQYWIYLQQPNPVRVD